jgi:hypothetical protein
MDRWYLALEGLMWLDKGISTKSDWTGRGVNTSNNLM